MGGFISRIISYFYVFPKNQYPISFRSINNQKWEEACLILQYRKLKNKNVDYKELIYIFNSNNSDERWEYYIITNQNTFWILQTEYIFLDSVMIFVNGWYNASTNQINWIL